jgi:hypothetical protein
MSRTCSNAFRQIRQFLVMCAYIHAKTSAPCHVCIHTFYIIITPNMLTVIHHTRIYAMLCIHLTTPTFLSFFPPHVLQRFLTNRASLSNSLENCREHVHVLKSVLGCVRHMFPTRGHTVTVTVTESDTDRRFNKGQRTF